VIKETSGDGETFARLYEEYLDKVFRYLQYRVNNMQLAEDLTSTVFEKALANFGKYNAEKASFSTWLFSIARNVVIDHYRASSKRRTVYLEEAMAQPSSALSPEEELERKDERERLNMSLAELSEEEQEIIRLKFGAELNNRQIAKMSGLSESNVGTKLYRAVRKMRDSFRESQNG
jgi:RNA polymerase sigma-70 factor (ECF subfamily)